MRPLTAFALLASLAGCRMVPARDAKEFRAQVSGGMVTTDSARRDVDRPFPAVFGAVKAQADRCFNKTVIRTRGGDARFPSGHSSEAYYRSSTKKLREGAAELTIQLDAAAYRLHFDVPPGGIYLEVGDIEAVGPGRTRVTLYGMSYGKDYFDAILSWARGEDASCPSLK